MNNLKKIILKERIKNILLDLLFLAIVFLFAWIGNKWYEMFIYVLTYTLIRNEFIKAVHGSDFTKSSSKAIKYCRYITIGVQTISIIFIINIDTVKYVNLILAFVLGIINFFTKDYLEYKLNKLVFYKGMKPEEIPSDLKGIEYEIIYQYYIKRFKLDKIAINLNYSIDNVKKIKAKIINRYS